MRWPADSRKRLHNSDSWRDPLRFRPARGRTSNVRWHKSCRERKTWLEEVHFYKLESRTLQLLFVVLLVNYVVIIRAHTRRIGLHIGPWSKNNFEVTRRPDGEVVH